MGILEKEPFGETTVRLTVPQLASGAIILVLLGIAAGLCVGKTYTFFSRLPTLNSVETTHERP